MVKEDTPLSITVGDVTGVFLPDGSSDLRFIYDEAVGSRERAQRPVDGVEPGSATGRYVLDRRFGDALHPLLPAPCPLRRAPPTYARNGSNRCPATRSARARRAALIAVDQRYPEATEATVTQANVVRIDPKTGDIMDRPCTGSVGERSIEVSLRFVPRSLPDGRLLLGMQDGFDARLLPGALSQRTPHLERALRSARGRGG